MPCVFYCLFTARVAVSVLVGLLAAIVAFYVYKLGVFCMGFFVGLVSFLGIIIFAIISERLAELMLESFLQLFHW